MFSICADDTSERRGLTIERNAQADARPTRFVARIDERDCKANKAGDQHRPALLLVNAQADA